MGLNSQLYLLISLGILCFLLLLLIVIISGKQIKDRCTVFCAKRKSQQITKIKMDTDSSANLSEETQHTDEHLAATLYATVNKKIKKQKKVESCITTTVNQQQTYMGTDGTGYLGMDRCGSDPAGFGHKNKRPPPLRPSPYEPVTYASIDHNLTAPPLKMKENFNE